MLNSVTAKSNFRIHFERRAKISWVPNSKSYQNCSILLGYFSVESLWDTLQASASLDILLNAKSRLQTGALQTESTTSYEMVLNHHTSSSNILWFNSSDPRSVRHTANSITHIQQPNDRTSHRFVHSGSDYGSSRQAEWHWDNEWMRWNTSKCWS